MPKPKKKDYIGVADYQVSVCTSEYRGDHAADVRKAVYPEDGELAEELIKRCQDKMDNPEVDHIEIQIRFGNDED